MNHDSAESVFPETDSTLVLLVLGIWLSLRILTLFLGFLLQRCLDSWPAGIVQQGNLFRRTLSPWLKWDVHYYKRIIEVGYVSGNGTAQFHPLFPWLSVPLAYLTGSSQLGLLIVSSIAALGFLSIYVALDRLDNGLQAAHHDALLLLFSPYAFALFLPYTESLFLLWTVLVLWALRQQKWWLAGLCGALATLTRQQGLFLLIPFLAEWWECNDRQWWSFLSNWHQGLSLVLIPLAMLVWIGYRMWFIDGLSLQPVDFHDLVYSIIISPDADRVVAQQSFMWPWKAFYLASVKFLGAPDLDLGINLVLGIIFLGLMIINWSRLRRSYKMYVACIVLISFAYYTGPVHPYMGLPRHLLLAFPVFFGLSRQLPDRKYYLLIIAIGGIGLLLLLSLFVMHAGWVP